MLLLHLWGPEANNKWNWIMKIYREKQAESQFFFHSIFLDLKLLKWLKMKKQQKQQNWMKLKQKHLAISVAKKKCESRIESKKKGYTRHLTKGARIINRNVKKNLPDQIVGNSFWRHL